MSSRFRRIVLATWVVTLAAAPALSQAEKPTPRVPLTGLYRVSNVRIGATDVSMDFTASLFNPGDREVEGSVVLRDPRIAGRIWADFGEQTIPARGPLQLSDVVRVPREIYESWSKGDAPAIFVNIENDRGDLALHRVSLSRA